MALHFQAAPPIRFPSRLIQLRKTAGLTQHSLAEAAEAHIKQMCRNEAGLAQPTLVVLIRLAKAGHVSLDGNVFEHGARGPDDEFHLRFEALSPLDANGRNVVKKLLDGMLFKCRARKLATLS